MQLNHCHLQLTQACNLNCHFCGQNHVAAGELTAAEWFDLLAQMAELPVLPKLTVWGGEPLLSPIFPAVAEKAAAMGFSMELITNGTLLDRYSSLIKNNFRRVCVSVDGPEDIHDAIRGKGVFRKLSRNLPLISGGNANSPRSFSLQNARNFPRLTSRTSFKLPIKYLLVVQNMISFHICPSLSTPFTVDKIRHRVYIIYRVIGRKMVQITLNCIF